MLGPRSSNPHAADMLNRRYRERERELFVYNHYDETPLLAGRPALPAAVQRAVAPPQHRSALSRCVVRSTIVALALRFTPSAPRSSLPSDLAPQRTGLHRGRTTLCFLAYPYWLLSIYLGPLLCAPELALPARVRSLGARTRPRLPATVRGQQLRGPGPRWQRWRGGLLWGGGILRRRGGTISTAAAGLSAGVLRVPAHGADVAAGVLCWRGAAAAADGAAGGAAAVGAERPGGLAVGQVTAAAAAGQVCRTKGKES